MGSPGRTPIGLRISSRPWVSEPRSGSRTIDSPQGRIVSVQPDITSIERSFDYLIPPEWEVDGRAERVQIGSMVRVDFNGRRTAGWVTDADVERRDDVKLLPLAKLSGVGPPADIVDLAHWAAWRWAGRVPHFLRAASPPRMVAHVREQLDLPQVEAPEGSSQAFSGPLTLVQTTPSDNGIALATAAAAHGRALVLVPTIAQRDELASALQKRGVPVARYNEQWERAAAGAVTVGTRLAAWAPVPDLGAVLVLDEHDSTYKEERTPAWNARDVAVERARRSGIPCVLASPSPSLESLESADRRLVPERSTTRNGWPILDVIDLRKTETPGLLTEHIVPLVRGEGPVACVLNRKGRARMLACATCDSLASCDACGIAVTQPNDSLVCPSCGTTRPVVCTECGGTKMKMIRPGIGRLAEELRALAKTDVVEVTAETPLKDLRGNRLLIGTEALLRRLPYARVVIFLDFDQELAAPRSRVAEDAFSLLALAARRVGPRAEGGRVVVQTRRPDDVVVQAALHGDPDRVARSQRDIRQVFRQPPYGAWAVVSGPGASEYMDRLDPSGLRVDRLGDRWRLAADEHDHLLNVLAATRRPTERVRIEVDPLDL